jgi:hypothetical protein
VLLHGNRVERNITEEDRRYIDVIMDGALSPIQAERLPYNEQIRYIREVQKRVLTVASVNKGIPYGSTREPKDLHARRHGLCFDRSWVIEKILMSKGFRVRHVALYSTEGWWPSWIVTFIPGVSSHALCEVGTARGWLVVDSNSEWNSIGYDGGPVPLSRIDKVGARFINWDTVQAVDYPPIFDKGFIYIYGLHSRHGNFFPPYLPVPDICWTDMHYNFESE